MNIDSCLQLNSSTITPVKTWTAFSKADAFFRRAISTHCPVGMFTFKRNRFNTITTSKVELLFLHEYTLHLSQVHIEFTTLPYHTIVLHMNLSAGLDELLNGM